MVNFGRRLSKGTEETVPKASVAQVKASMPGVPKANMIPLSTVIQGKNANKSGQAAGEPPATPGFASSWKGIPPSGRQSDIALPLFEQAMIDFHELEDKPRANEKAEWALAEEIAKLGIAEVTVGVAWPIAKVLTLKGWMALWELKHMDDSDVDSCFPKASAEKQHRLLKEVILRAQSAPDDGHDREEPSTSSMEGLMEVVGNMAKVMTKASRGRKKVKVILGFISWCRRGGP
jgi:hypothetical protein